jgi:hypothetical protein
MANTQYQPYTLAPATSFMVQQPGAKKGSNEWQQVRRPALVKDLPSVGEGIKKAACKM